MVGEVKPEGDASIYRLHENWVSALRISPDGSTIASGSRDGTIQLVNLQEGTGIASLEGNGKPINALAFSPSGDVLAAAVHDGGVYLWRLPEASLVGILTDIDILRVAHDLLPE